jgi:tetratricopeptide (TPR) repeat protein
MPSQRKSFSDHFALLVEELTEKLQAGEPIDVEAFLGEHSEDAEQLRRLLPALLLLAEVSNSRDGPALGPTAGVELGELGDFRLIREVGRGGMGIVYEAEQVSLGRRVALKVLPFAATMDPRHLQRFQNEARAAAGLHHTNIVPVYAVGCERGVHYYAMQFIDGRTLAELIAQQRGGASSQVPAVGAAAAAVASVPTVPAAGRATSAAPRDAAYFWRAAEWAIQAAEALDGAHALGVVHRDVKPANLLVDGNGRLWVTDFGLAQVQNDARLTLSGDLVGTLRYMSPEQALAKRAVIDHRTDIYSLGATLYELLTLAPAFTGSDRQELLQQIAFEEPTRPRRLEKAIPAELETIVLKALEKDPADRYGTAHEMANDLERFLRDEPIRARRPPLWLRLRKWGRRHRPLVASLAAGMLTLLVVGVVLAFGYQRRLAETERGVTAALVQAETLVDEGDKLIDHPERWQATARLARAALERAEELLATGAATGSLTRRVEKDRAAVEAAVADSALLIELNRIRLERAAFKEGRFKVPDSALAYAKALGGYGVDLAAPESVGARIRGSRLRDALLAALEDWWRVTEDRRERQQLEEALQVANATDVARARWREAVHRPDSAALVKMATELAAQRLPAAVVCSRAADLSSLKEWAAAERLLKAAQVRDPGDFWLNHDLGSVIQEQGPTRAEEAIRYLQAALALRTDSPAAYVSLALALEDKGDVEGAIRCCRAALDINSKDGHAHNNLGVLLMNKGDLDGAIVCYRRAIDSDPKDAYAHNNLGYALRSKGNVDEALACFKKAIGIDPKYDSPYENLAAALQSMGKLDEAIPYLRRALVIDPNMAKAHSALGLALQTRGELEEAIACYRRATKIDPKNAYAHNNLGNALMAKGMSDEAIASFQKALVIKPTDARIHSNLSAALKDKGLLDEAVAECQEALHLDKDYPEAHCNLGHALLHQGKFAEALQAFRRGDALGRQRPGWPYPSAEWVRWAERLIALDGKLKATDTDPKKVRAYCGLGAALQAKGRLVEAMAFCRKAIALDPKFAGAHYNLGNALRDKHDLDGAIAAYHKAIDLDPKLAEAHCNLGQTLQEQGRFPEALEELRRGDALGRQRPDWRYPSADRVREAERLVALEAKLPKVLTGEVQPTDEAEWLVLARMCQHHRKQYAAAARLYAEAFASQPGMAENLETQLRYDAACAAALAGCGQGEDAAPLPDRERARLRAQALTWLRADLAEYASTVDKGPAPALANVQQRLRHWQQDPDFAGVRGDHLAGLPEAERQAWQQLWADVAATLTRAGGKAVPVRTPGST